jgi:tetratricopeptide (TPR) repeat protein
LFFKYWFIYIEFEVSMTTVLSFGRAAQLAGAIVSVVALSACTTAPVAPTVAAKPSLQSMLAQAGTASSTGQKEQAVTLWKQAAQAYPADKSPWLSIAQTRYETGQYGDAIINAQEVLVRDPNDTLANSIIAISGLRLSTRSLADLSRQNNLSGSIRTESQDLAKLLRESLGESVLVPPAAPVAQPAATPTRGKVAAKKGKAKSQDEDTSANPFGALK